MENNQKIYLTQSFIKTIDFRVLDLIAFFLTIYICQLSLIHA